MAKTRSGIICNKIPGSSKFFSQPHHKHKTRDLNDVTLFHGILYKGVYLRYNILICYTKLVRYISRIAVQIMVDYTLYITIRTGLGSMKRKGINENLFSIEDPCRKLEKQI
jgi:hypothetical protein